jgi:hypothetical protein
MSGRDSLVWDLPQPRTMRARDLELDRVVTINAADFDDQRYELVE